MQAAIAVHGRAAVSFAQADIQIGGESLVADAGAGLYWPAERALLVADLHLEKSSSGARRGVLLPPYDTAITLDRLARQIERWQPARVIALGDSLHDRYGYERISPSSRAQLTRLQRGRDWLWITGNHDPAIAPGLGGTVAATVTLRGITLRHDPTDSTQPEIAGHLHPVARLARRGAIVRRPCFASNGQRLILPAFGAYTGGLNVLNAAYAPHFPERRALAVWMLGRNGIYPVNPAHLRGDG